MDVKNILIWCVIGILAGWIASFVVGGGGLLRYLATGLIGAVVGGMLLNWSGMNVNLGNPYVNQVVVAAIGAIVVVLIARFLS